MGLKGTPFLDFHVRLKLNYFIGSVVEEVLFLLDYLKGIILWMFHQWWTGTGSFVKEERDAKTPDDMVAFL